MSNLESKKVLIVGGSSGIGAATATAFAGLGAEVTIASRNQAKLDAVAARISGHVRTAVLDTTDEAAVEAFFATAGQFDHVVISAAQTPGGPVRQLELSDAYAAMNSKFWGAYRVARVVKIAEGGSLTLVSGRVAHTQDFLALATFLITSHAITALVRHTRRLGEAHREQARLLDLTHDTILVTDMNRVISYWNRGAEEFYGWKREEAVGTVSHQLLKTIFPVALDDINEQLSRTGRWERGASPYQTGWFQGCRGQPLVAAP